MSDTLKKIINYILFQAGWFSIVISAAKTPVWLSVGIAIVILLLHVILQKNCWNELLFIFGVTIFGGFIDSVLYYFGIFNFNQINPWQPFATPWIWSLWLIFSTTLRHSLSWLQHKYWLAAGCGFFAGPLSYWAGERLSALVFNHLIISLITLALVWVWLLPFLVWLSIIGKNHVK